MYSYIRHEYHQLTMNIVDIVRSQKSSSVSQRDGDNTYSSKCIYIVAAISFQPNTLNSYFFDTVVLNSKPVCGHNHR